MSACRWQPTTRDQQRSRTSRVPVWWASYFLFVVGVLLFTSSGSAADAPEPPVSEVESADAGTGSHFNLSTPTLGGKQLWTDELVYHGWRIQRHFYTGHYRLLDDENHRRAWGSLQHCRNTLEQLKRQLHLPPLDGKVVILLHGIIRSRASMAGLGEYLGRHGDYTAMNVSYASTRGDLASHAAALARVMQNLDANVTEINFVAHSLGNLVIRRYLADCYRERNGLQPDRRLRRIVMLAPPNNGAHMAEKFKNNAVMDWVWGQSARELATGWDQLQKDLAVPRCEFGILAGGVGVSGTHVRWLEGDDDLVVSVDETKLPGAHDFAVLPVIHGWIMEDAKARKAVLTFLQHGYFFSESQRHPLEPAAAQTE